MAIAADTALVANLARLAARATVRTAEDTQAAAERPRTDLQVVSRGVAQAHPRRHSAPTSPNG